MEILTNNGYKVLIDKKDYELINKSEYSTIYVKEGKYVILQKYKNNIPIRIQLHRFLLGLGNYDGALLVDHKNGNTLDNRRVNLRVATKSQNGMNRGVQSNNSCNYKGVSYDKVNDKWRATISINGKQKSLGRHLNINDAAKAYNKAAREIHGEFAYINIISE